LGIGVGSLQIVNAGLVLTIYRVRVRSWFGRAGTIGPSAVTCSESDRSGWSRHSGQGLALVDHHQAAVGCGAWELCGDGDS